jgi:hypothetical protein
MLLVPLLHLAHCTILGTVLTYNRKRCVCHVAAVLCRPAGVGLAEGRKGAVKWSQLLKMFAGWVFTLVVGGLISGAIFAWGTFAPNKAYGTQILQYQRQIQYMTDAQLSALNAAAATNAAAAPAALSGVNSEWDVITGNSKTHVWPSTTIAASSVVSVVNSTASMFMQNSAVQFKP